MENLHRPDVTGLLLATGSISSPDTLNLTAHLSTFLHHCRGVRCFRYRLSFSLNVHSDKTREYLNGMTTRMINVIVWLSLASADSLVMAIWDSAAFPGDRFAGTLSD